MAGIVLSGYELVLVVWGVCWTILGTGMMYFLNRVMVADEREAEKLELTAPTADVARSADHARVGLAA